MTTKIIIEQKGTHEYTPAQNGYKPEGYPPYVCDDLIKNNLNPEQMAFRVGTHKFYMIDLTFKN